jgi:DNA-binding response OmpR family regulator
MRDAMKKILVIEDDPHLIQALQLLLEYSDYEVGAALDGEQGLQAAIAAPPDLIITDIGLPKRDGISIIREVQKKNPQVKIIAISGIPGQAADYLANARHHGACAVLAKPFRQQDLLAAIQTALAA